MRMILGKESSVQLCLQYVLHSTQHCRKVLGNYTITFINAFKLSFSIMQIELYIEKEMISFIFISFLLLTKRKHFFVVQTIQLFAQLNLISWSPSTSRLPAIIHLTYKAEMMLFCWVSLGSLYGVLFWLLSLDCSLWNCVFKVVLPISLAFVAAASIAVSLVSIASSSTSQPAAFTASFEACAPGVVITFTPGMTVMNPADFVRRWWRNFEYR
jgi:hypothetical protein